MKRYVDYWPSGKLAQTYSCPDDVTPVPMEGATALAIDPGVELGLCYVDVQTGNLARMPERPSRAYVFDYAAKQWQDPRTLQDCQAAKWVEIKRARQAALNAPLVTPFGAFDADSAGQDNISRGVLLANNLAALGYPVAINFTLHDNSVKVLDAPAMVQVGLLLGGRVQLIRDKATALREQIDAATTAAHLDAITWDPYA